MGRKGLPGEGAGGAWWEGERLRGGCGGVEGRFGSPGLPAVEVRGRKGGAPRCSLFKRPAEARRAWPALAAQTCRAGFTPSRVRQWAPGLSGCGPLAPSCSRALPPPPAASPLRVFLAPPVSRSLSSALSRSLSFFPAAATAAAAAPPGARISAACARRSARAPLPSPPGAPGWTPLPGAASPAPFGSYAGLGGAGAGLASWLAVAGAAAERRALGGGSGRAAASSSPLRPGLRAAPRPARSAASAPSAAARAPGSASSQPPPPPPPLCAPGAGGSATDPSPRLRPRRRAVSCGPPETRGGDCALRPLGRGLRREHRGSGRWPLTGSRAQGCREEGWRIRALGAGGSSFGAGAVSPNAPEGRNGAAAFFFFFFPGPGGKCLCLGGLCQVLPDGGLRQLSGGDGGISAPPLRRGRAGGGAERYLHPFPAVSRRECWQHQPRSPRLLSLAPRPAPPAAPAPPSPPAGPAAARSRPRRVGTAF